jgi:hypothetical protein
MPIASCFADAADVGLTDQLQPYIPDQCRSEVKTMDKLCVDLAEV